MSFTQLDSNTALLVVDLQQGIVAVPLAQELQPILDNAVKLIQAFRQRDLPVVLINVEGAPKGRTNVSRPPQTITADWADLLPILDQQPSDILITKRNWGAFINTDLEHQLRQRSITQVVVIGLVTSIGVESTARQAFELGFNVSICSDAVADRAEINHTHALEVIFPRLGEVGTTEELLGLL